MFVLSLQKVKTGVDPSPFAVWSKMRIRDEPDPETGSMWINSGAELRSTGYTAKFKERQVRMLTLSPVHLTSRLSCLREEARRMAACG